MFSSNSEGFLFSSISEGSASSLITRGPCFEHLREFQHERQYRCRRSSEIIMFSNNSEGLLFSSISEGSGSASFLRGDLVSSTSDGFETSSSVEVAISSSVEGTLVRALPMVSASL